MVVHIAIIGDSYAKNSIIDDLEEYFAYVEIPVKIDLSNEIDKMFRCKRGAELEHSSLDEIVGFSEEDRLGLAHMYLATKQFFVNHWDVIFFHPSSHEDTDQDYHDLCAELGVADDVVHLWQDPASAGQQIIDYLEELSEHDDPTGTQDRTSVRSHSDHGESTEV